MGLFPSPFPLSQTSRSRPGANLTMSGEISDGHCWGAKDHWQSVERGQGCYQTSYNAQPHP